jgi:hypothetical protein
MSDDKHDITDATDADINKHKVLLQQQKEYLQ